MSDCLYGKLNSETIKKEYVGTIEAIEENKVGTADIAVDNVKNTLKVQVNKTPGTLKITKSVNIGEKETLVEFDGSESKEINLDEVDAYTGIENETSKTTVDTEHNLINVEVKRTPGKIKFEKGGKILTDHLGNEVAFDGFEDTTLHIPETSFETTETFEAVYDETTNKVKGNVLKVPHTLTIVDENTGTQQMFDGGEDFGDITITIPGSGKGVEQLIGTEEKPINLATDMEVGKLYSITGKILYQSNSFLSNMDYYVPCFKVSNTQVIIYGANVYYTAAALYDGRYNTMLEFNSSTGIVSQIRNSQMVGKINGSNLWGHSPDIYVPTSGGINGQILQSNGDNAPTWITPNYATQDDITNAIGNVSSLLGNTDDLGV